MLRSLICGRNPSIVWGTLSKASSATRAITTSSGSPGDLTPEQGRNEDIKDKDHSVEQSSKKPGKSIAERDEELRRKMSGISGDGGEAGIEYEDGRPVSMKRSVKNNMFRYI